MTPIRIMMPSLAAGLVLALMALPGSAAKPDDAVEISQSQTPADASGRSIPQPPPGPFNAPLRPELTAPPLTPPALTAPAIITPAIVTPDAYPPVDFDPEASPEMPASAPPMTVPAIVTPDAYPPLPDDSGESVIPAPRRAPLETRPVETRNATPGAQPVPRAGGRQNFVPWAGRPRPPFGANPYGRPPRQGWGQYGGQYQRQNPQQNGWRAPGWPMPNPPYPPPQSGRPAQ